MNMRSAMQQLNPAHSKRHCHWRRPIAALAIGLVCFLLANGSSRAQAPTNDEIGFSPNHVFNELLEGEHVDVLTGNVNIRIPIGPTYRVGNQLSYQVQLYYNSKIWEHQCSSDLDECVAYCSPGECCVWGPEGGCPGVFTSDDTLGLGFSFHFGRIYHHPDDRDGVYRYQSPHGGEQYFEWSDTDGPGDWAPTIDAEGVWVTQQAGSPNPLWVVFPGDGTRLIFGQGISTNGPSGVNHGSHGWYVTRIETVATKADGVTPEHFLDVQYSYFTYAGTVITQLEDSTGRLTTFDYSIPDTVFIDVPAYGGGTARYELELSNTDVVDPTPYEDVATSYSRAQLVGIVLPELGATEKYTFGYTQFGQLNEWTIPTGATIKYHYSAYPSSLVRPYHVEMAARELISEGESYLWTYTRWGDNLVRSVEDVTEWLDELFYSDGYPTGFSYSNSPQVTVLDPFGNRTVYSFRASTLSDCNSSSECVGEWDDGLLSSVELYAGDWTTPVKKTEHDYTYEGELFVYRDRQGPPINYGPPDYEGDEPHVMAINSRRSSVRTTHYGAGIHPTVITEVVSNEWTGDAHPQARRIAEYVDGGLKRSTYKAYYADYLGFPNLDKRFYRWVHTYIELRDAGEAVVSKTTRTYEEGRLKTEVDDFVTRTLTYDADTGLLENDTRQAGADTAATDYEYSNAGHLKARTHVGMTWKSLSQSTDDNTGLTMSRRGPNPIDTTYSWDQLGRLEWVNPYGPEYHVSINYDTLRQTTVRQGSVASGNYTENVYLYDDLGRLVEERRRTEDGSQVVQFTTYDIAGEMTGRSEWAPIATPEPELHWTVYDRSWEGTQLRDPLGRVWRVEGPSGQVTETEYMGLAKRVTVHGIHGIDGPINAWTTYVNDGLNRLVSVDSPGDGADAMYEYDLQDNLVEVRLTDSSAPPEQELVQIRRFGYDSRGRLRFATNPESGTVDYLSYGARDQLLEWQDAGGHLFKNTYDSAGRIQSRAVDVGGSFVDLAVNTYDTPTDPEYPAGASLGKLVEQRSYQLGPDGAPGLVSTRRYMYGTGDAADCSPSEEFPPPPHVTHAGLNGRLMRTVTRIAPLLDEFETYHCQDLFGQPALTAYPDVAESGRTRAAVGYLWHNGFLHQVYDANRAVEYISDVEYDAHGAPTKIVRGNATRDVIARDLEGRPLNIEVWKAPHPYLPIDIESATGCTAGGGSGLVDLQFCGGLPEPKPPASNFVWQTGMYQYDLAGNIREIGGDSYAYDALSRLAAATVTTGGEVYDTVYDYDAFGNMTRRTRFNRGMNHDDRVFLVDPLKNRLTSQDHQVLSAPIETTGFQFDASGNMTAAGPHGYVFDPSGRMTAVTGPDGPINQSFYDSSGYRVRTITDGMETYYLRDADGTILSEYRRLEGSTATPGWNKDYVYALGSAYTLVKNSIPSPPERPRALESSAFKVTIEWDAPAEPDVDQYWVVGQLEEPPGSYTIWDGLSHDAGTLRMSQTFAQNEITSSSVLTYTVASRDRAANQSEPSLPLVVRPLGSPPPQPTNLAASPTDRAVSLTWDAVVDDDLRGYQVERSDDGGTTWVLLTIWAVPTNAYFDTGLVNGQTYHYRVRAVDTTGRTSPPTSSVMAIPIDNVGPGRPTNLRARPGRMANRILVSWDEVLDADVASYELHRDGSLLETLQVSPPAHPTLYVDENGIQGGQEYAYRVRAIDAAGNESDWSEERRTYPRIGGSPMGVPSGLTAEFEVDHMGTCFNESGPECPICNGCCVDIEHDDVIQVRLTWDYGGPARVYRAPGDGSEEDFEPIAEVQCLSGPGHPCDEYIDRDISEGDYKYYVVGILDYLEPPQETAALPEGASGEDDRAVEPPVDTQEGVRTVQTYKAFNAFPASNSASRYVEVTWARIVSTQVKGYHVYRKADWSSCGGAAIAGPIWEREKVRQTEFHPDTWIRLTDAPVDSAYRWVDATLGGLGGCFLYAVRAVFQDGTEGPMSDVIGLTAYYNHNNAEYEPSMGNAYYDQWECDADNKTLDIEVFPNSSFPYLFLGGTQAIPTEDEAARVNGVSKGALSAEGPPPAPASVELTLRRMPGFDPWESVLESLGECQGHTEYDLYGCLGYVPGMRHTLYAEIAWDSDPAMRPSDLRGYYIEVAGGPSGPWRRVTPQPVAWWERFYRLSGIAVRNHDDTAWIPDPGCLHMRVIAVDDAGLESAPASPATVADYTDHAVGDPPVELVAYPPAGCGVVATPEAPQNLRASTEVPGTTPCETRLEWEPVDGAIEYSVYRYVGTGGLFFYRTQTVRASACTQALCSYVESGDGDNMGDPDPNIDCPSALHWSNGWASWEEPGPDHQNCETGNLDAYYVRVRGATGGEGPRSEIVFWDCDEEPGYALMMEDGETGADDELDTRVCLVADRGEGDSTPDDDTLAGTVGPLGVPFGSDSPETAPLLTLGQSAQDPPYELLNLHHDHLGSTRVVTDEEGEVVSQHDFMPFGEEIVPLVDHSTKLFTGHERDAATGLDYMLARYYSNGLTRFLSVDPSRRSARRADPQSWNRYPYVGNNPLGYFDPNGEYRRSVTARSGPSRDRSSQLAQAGIKADRRIASNKGSHLSKAHKLQQNQSKAYDVVLDDSGTPGNAKSFRRSDSGFSYRMNNGNDAGGENWLIVIPTQGLEGQELIDTIEDSLVHELTEIQIVEDGEGGPLNQEAHEEAEEVEEKNREEREAGEGDDQNKSSAPSGSTESRREQS